MSLFQTFSRAKIMSILMLVTILVLSLLLSSFREGMDNIAIINADAPKGNAETTFVNANVNTKLANSKHSTTDAIILGNPSNTILTVEDIKNQLKNDKSVQALLTNLPLKQ
jgi:hypothetical protein